MPFSCSPQPSRKRPPAQRAAAPSQSPAVRPRPASPMRAPPRRAIARTPSLESPRSIPCRRVRARTHFDAPDAHQPGRTHKDAGQTQAVPRAPRAPQPQFTPQRPHPPRTPQHPLRTRSARPCRDPINPRRNAPAPKTVTAKAALSPCRRAAQESSPSDQPGDDRDRTGDPLLAKQVLSQLSYAPSLGPSQGPNLPRS